MKNYVYSGATVTLPSASRAITSGGGVLVSNFFGFASDDIASGASGEIQLEGVFDHAKDASTFNPGDKVYWDNTAFLLTSTVSSNKLVGGAILDTPVTGQVRVRLNGATV